MTNAKNKKPREQNSGADHRSKSAGAPNGDVVNFDEIIKKASIEQPKYIQKSIYIKWPFRICISGGSGTGKSNIMLNILMNHAYFDKLYIFCKDPSEDKYQLIEQELESLQNKLEKKLKREIEPLLLISTDLDEIPDLNELDPEKQHLFVFDDMVNLSEREQKPINDIFIRGRKRNCSVIYLSQSFTNIPKIIRKNCNYHIVTSVSNSNELNDLATKFGIKINPNKFKQIWRKIAAEDHAFMMIDLTTPYLCEAIRMNFNGYLDPEFCAKED